MSAARRQAKVKLIGALLKNPLIVDVDQGHYREADGTPGEVWTELEAEGVVLEGELAPDFSTVMETAVNAAIMSKLEVWGVF